MVCGAAHDNRMGRFRVSYGFSMKWATDESRDVSHMDKLIEV